MLSISQSSLINKQHLKKKIMLMVEVVRVTKEAKANFLTQNFIYLPELSDFCDARCIELQYCLCIPLNEILYVGSMLTVAFPSSYYTVDVHSCRIIDTNPHRSYIFIIKSDVCFNVRNPMVSPSTPIGLLLKSVRSAQASFSGGQRNRRRSCVFAVTRRSL